MEKYQFCSKCGAKIDVDAHFCTKCGAAIAAGNLQQEPILQKGSKQPKNNGKSAKTIIIIIAVLIVLAVVVFGGIRLAQNIAKDNKEKKEKEEIENAITEAFDNAENATEFKCNIKADARTNAHVGSKSIDGTYTVSTNAVFKDEKAYMENGAADAILISGGNISSRGLNYNFETYITETGDIYTKKDDENYKKMEASFSKDDLVQYMDEIKNSYDDKNKKCDGNTITINGTLTDGIDIYNSYINYLAATAAEPENYPVSDRMDYELTISKSEKMIQKIVFRLKDVEKIWFGVADDELTIDNAYGEFDIEFKSFDDVSEIEIPAEIEISGKDEIQNKESDSQNQNGNSQNQSSDSQNQGSQKQNSNSQNQSSDLQNQDSDANLENNGSIPD